MSVFIGFQGFRLVSRWFHGFSRFLVGFHGVSSYFHGFSWYLVGFHGFQVGLMVSDDELLGNT